MPHQSGHLHYNAENALSPLPFAEPQGAVFQYSSTRALCLHRDDAMSDEAATASSSTPVERGRAAASPWRIPIKGWWDIIRRIQIAVGTDHLTIIAAGIAMLWFLALFPVLISIFSIYGLWADPGQVEQQVNAFAEVLPETTREFLANQMKRLAGQATSDLGWGLIIGLGAAIWSSSKGVRSLMQALNIAYREQEKRGFIKTNAFGLFLTFVLLLAATIALAVIIGIPAVLNFMGLDGVLEFVLGYLRWPALLVFVILVLSVLYRWGPARANARWRWISPGALIAALVWLLGSWLFSFFVSHFGNFANTYGSVAAIVILILWFNLSAFIVILGAKINAEIEHQTHRDSTTGEPQPMGERGAHVADNVGQIPGKKPEDSTA
ncbi:MAG: YihY/virulence factor BrkB family protein [Opitutales bacterium]